MALSPASDFVATTKAPFGCATETGEGVAALVATLIERNGGTLASRRTAAG